MATETNSSQTPVISLTPLQFITLVLTIVGILVTQSFQLEDIRRQVNAADSDRQADTRAVNARVDGFQQLVVASQHSAPTICSPVT